MPCHWALRWLVMLLLFALSTFAVASHAGASPPKQSTVDADVTEESGREFYQDDDDDDAVAQPRAPREYMFTVTRNALWGAALGGLVGGSVYFIGREQFSPWIILYFVSGGILVGAVVGAVEVAVRETRQPYGVEFFDDSSIEEALRRAPDSWSIPFLRFFF